MKLNVIFTDILGVLVSQHAQVCAVLMDNVIMVFVFVTLDMLEQHATSHVHWLVGYHAIIVDSVMLWASVIVFLVFVEMIAQAHAIQAVVLDPQSSWCAVVLEFARSRQEYVHA